MSPPSKESRERAAREAEGAGQSQRTVMMPAPTRRPPTSGRAPVTTVPAMPAPRPPAARQRAWVPFRFANLEKVSGLQVELVQRLEWMMPGLKSTGQVSESVRKRLTALLEDEVALTVDYVHVVSPKNLRRYIGEPTFLTVLSAIPNRTRGLLEVELSLAHAAIDLLLGGAGEAVALRPLTDIEEGVMTYVILETLKAFAPGLDPSLPRLRLEGVAHGFDEVAGMVEGEAHLAIAQLKLQVGPHTGYVRMMVPQSVLALANPPYEAEVRRLRRMRDATAHASRLRAVKTWLRAEIGQVEISSGDIAQLAERDVVLVDLLSARPDKGDPGTARVKVGLGRAGSVLADVFVEDGRYKARVTGFELGLPAVPATDEGAAADAADEGDPQSDESSPQARSGETDVPSLSGPDESTNPGISAQRSRVDEAEKSDGAELLQDIPLQIAVELGRVPITADEVVALKVGQVIDLNRLPGEPLDLSVNGKVIARGELVEVDGNLGVRVLSMNG